MPKTKAAPKKSAKAQSYRHPTAEVLLRPDVGTQAQFKKPKAPKKYRYDSSLSPALEWDGQNSARERGEGAIRDVQVGVAELDKAVDALKTALGSFPSDTEANVRKALTHVREAAGTLRSISKPFLNWAGKAEHLSFDVPTLPLFIHERLSTKAIIETLVSHKRDKQESLFDLFGDPEHSITDQVLRAYVHRDKWVNRMILGDSLIVMNSLLEYEGLGGQVQMIYIDPPYGVQFGSNFQPFVRRRNVEHADDDDMTREPEMVQAYRDTWSLSSHSYLTYLRDRLLVSRELLHPSGSLFVQISDENLHHVREILDEVFGRENFVVIICYRRLGMMVGETLQSSAHYLLWYAKDKERLKYRKLFERQQAGIGAGDHYSQIENVESSETRPMTGAEKADPALLPDGWKPFQLISLSTGNYRPNLTIPFEFEGRTYHPGANKHWRATKEGLDRLVENSRIVRAGSTIRYKQYLDDFPFSEVTTIWTDTARDPENFYVVQTPSNVIRRCVLMTTDPGDLVLDPTCGGGATAYVAEQCGRRWITMDVSRVPLALARQRLLTATFLWYELKHESAGPAGGFVYRRKQNKKGVEVGGIVPHVTLETVAKNEMPKEEILVDVPEVLNDVTRVTGPFCVEATIPTPIDEEGDSISTRTSEEFNNCVDRMLEALQRSPVLRLDGNKTLTLKNVRTPAKTLSLSAEALTVQNGDKPVAFVFGPENGAVSEKLVWEAAREAKAKDYTQLYVIGFSIQPHARQLVENSHAMVGIPATYVQATPDLLLGDLLKTMRSSEIFSVCGLPEIEVKKLKDGKHQVQLLGLDVFDPVTMEVIHRHGDDVPAWLLDTNYNGLVFHVTQAFFPRTGAWDNLKKALRAEYEESVWDHLAGTTSAPFEAGEHRQIAVKVIDDRGNELLVVQSLAGNR